MDNMDDPRGSEVNKLREDGKPIGKPFTKGFSGNPDGRPKGSLSIKTKIKNYLEDHPEKLEELMTYYIETPAMRDLLWKMVDGLPKQSVEVDMPQSLIELIKNAKSLTDGDK